MISQKIVNNLSNGSWIRAMFEEGDRLRKIHGPDKVFDFSIGNPDLEPPKAAKEVMKKLILEDKPGLHGYMGNAGYDDVRQKVADTIHRNTGLPFSFEHIVMTCGAGGGLNVVLKTLLNPGEEVIVFPPFFVEYGFYIDNHGGKMVKVPTNTETFQPDANALKNAITPQTKALIINTPNNPTGVVYSEDTLRKLAEVLKAKEQEYGTTIYLISDEPYNKLVYDGAKLPSIPNIFKNSIVVDSFSKSLSLPGERIGYIAVNPAIEDVKLLVGGLIFCNRTLGFVNAPGFFQRVIGEVMDEIVDTEDYKRRRDVIYNHLISLGFNCIKPEGAFYLFPKALIEDDVAFVKHATKYNILLVPGTGFGCPGYFRLCYCASMKTIENSLPAFEALANDFKK